MMPKWLLAWMLVVVAAAPLAVAAAPGSACTGLTQLALPQARVTAAGIVAAGAFRMPGAQPDAKVAPEFLAAPAFCRAQLLLRPSPDSDIRVEVWLPLRGWNGRLRGQDNGGFAGSINYGGLATAVGQGYATASTDTGHVGGNAAWALGHPEKVIDFGYRAVHLMTVDAKAVLKAFYGTPARYAYFAGCSDGGREALMEAQRYPDDYNGIIAGAPAYDWTHLLANALGIMQHADSVAGYIPPAQLPLITAAVLKACDANDGVVDGVLNDPRACRFNPAVLTCAKGAVHACLTPAQVATLKIIYAGARDSAGKRVYYGTQPGAEDAPGSWGAWIFGRQRGDNAMAFFVDNYFADMVYANPHWNYRDANLTSALALAERKTGHALDAVDANLAPFLAHGGKLILYHGWNDPAISPLATVAYYERVVKKLGAQRARRALRLYLVPGMLHCDGGPGAHAFGQNATDPRADPRHDVFAALVDWVEQGRAPRSIIATKYAAGGPGKRVAFTRPLCPYPEAARYRGTGNKHQAAAFACAAPRAAAARNTAAQPGVAGWH